MENCDYTLLTSILKQRANITPSKIAYTFLLDGEQDEVSISYKELYLRSIKIATYLQSNCNKGDRVVMFFSPGIEFIVSFLACLYAGVIAIPSYPPKQNKKRDKVDRILRDSHASFILTSENDPIFNSNFYKLDLPVLKIEDANLYSSQDFSPILINIEDLAFIQYTSGSTSLPKGVMISHSNLIHNEGLIQESFNISDTSIIVGWLPFYHDMGLLGNIVQALFSGARCILMSPIHFLQKPVRWLKAITKYRGTVSGGPDFAYDFCIKKIVDEECLDLDLSSWVVAFNGSEPVRPSTLRNFHGKFCEYGFNFESFMPVYGMAESTLLIASHTLSECPKISKFPIDKLPLSNSDFFYEKGNTGEEIELVSCGQWNEYKLILVDQYGKEVTGKQAGEILISSKSVSSGYYNQPEDSFFVKISNYKEKFFKTGDIGIIENNSLYIVGRIKDMLIYNGRNIYPYDIEDDISTLCEHIIPHSTIIFSLDSFGKDIVILTEVQYMKEVAYSEILTNILTLLTENYGVVPYDILLLRRGSIFKTTSGKIQRDTCRLYYSENKFEFILSYRSFENSHILNEINSNPICNAVILELNDTGIDMNTDLISMGLDSIKIVRISYILSNHLQKNVTPDLIYKYKSLSKIIKNIEEISPIRSIPTLIPRSDYELSELQKIIWVNQKNDVDNTSYNVYVIEKMSTQLDFSLLQHAFEILLNNYPLLRVKFESDSTNVRQVIRQDYIGCIKIEKITVESFKLEQVIKTKLSEPFDLGDDLLIRLVVISLPKNDYLFIIAHHIIVDGHSMLTIMEKMKSVYNELVDSLKIDNKEVDYGYFSYVDYEKEFIIKDFSKKNFWIEELKCPLPKLDLPKDLNYSNKETVGSSFVFYLDESRLNNIHSFAKKNQINLFSFYLSAYFLLLYRLTGNSDIIVGIPFSTRLHQNYLASIGLFINTLMFRVKIDKINSLYDFLIYVFNKGRELFSYADYPFGQVLIDNSIKESDDQLSVTSVFFNYMDYIQDFDEYEYKLFQNYGNNINFDLNLYALPCKNNTLFRLDYNKNKFSEKSIQKIGNLYLGILDDLLTKFHDKVGSIRSFCQESANLICPANEFIPFNIMDMSCDIIHRFNYVVENYPDNLAIITNKVSYSYRETAFEVSDLTSRILLAVAAHNVAIGLFLGHNESMVFGILAVLNSDNYYIPLAIDYPKDRIGYMIKDSNMKLIITDNSNYDNLYSILDENNLKVSILNVSECSAVTNSTLSTIDQISRDKNSIAYILYTSGSTGFPKGVVQDKEYVMSLTASFTNSLHISSKDCISLVASFNFSASVMDLFGGLLNGASLCLIDIKKDGIVGLYDSLKIHNVTLYHSVPTVFRNLTDFIIEKEYILPTIRLIYLAGEQLLKGDFEKYKLCFDDQSLLVNGFGCTEMNIARQFFMNKNSEVQDGAIPVGYRTFDTDILILNAEGEVSANNETGEIVIKSSFLAKEYLGRDELTHSKFDISDNDGKFLFYTGDIGRKLIDGCLIHLGRKDSQIKLRGQRIELGEIEFYMSMIPSVSRAIANVITIGEEKFICLYYIADKELEIDEIRSHLNRDLASYMIPSYFIRVSDFIYTDTGKINRSKLPLPDISKGYKFSSANFFTDLELEVITIWTHVLNIESNLIDLNSNFFDLGGHSLKAILLIQEIKKVFNKELTLNNIFENPSVKDLSSFIQSKPLSDEIELKYSEKKDYYDLSYQQKQLWVITYDQLASSAYNINKVLRIDKSLDKNVLESFFAYLKSKYSILRTVFLNIKGKPYQKIIHDDNALIRINIKDSSVCTLEDLLESEVNTEFKIEEYPLFRITLYKSSDNYNYLIIIIHHLIADGWSFDVILREFYAFISGKHHLKITNSLQYIDYIEFVNKIGNPKESQMFWDNILKGISNLELPYDFPKSNLSLTKSGQEIVIIDKSLTLSINNALKATGTTLFSYIVSLIEVLLYRYTQQDDITLSVVSLGRRNAGFFNQIGLFAIALPLRIRLIADLIFSELAQKVKEALLEIFNNELSLYKTLYSGSYDISSIYKVVIVFNNVDFSLSEVDFENSKVKVVSTNSPVNKFDLCFIIEQIEGVLSVKIEYNSELFTRDKIISMGNNLKHIASYLSLNLDTKIH